MLLRVEPGALVEPDEETVVPGKEAEPSVVGVVLAVNPGGGGGSDELVVVLALAEPVGMSGGRGKRERD